MEKSLPSPIPSANCVFEGKRFAVYVGEKKEAIAHPGAAVILPIVNGKEILLIKNERFVVHQTLWEVPAGTLEPGEEPIKAAGRELIEETGYQAQRIEPLFTFYPSPGFCNEKMHVFCAFELSYVGQNLDPTEKIEVVKVTWNQALEMVKDGTIQDGKTISTLLFYHAFRMGSN